MESVEKAAELWRERQATKLLEAFGYAGDKKGEWHLIKILTDKEILQNMQDLERRRILCGETRTIKEIKKIREELADIGGIRKEE